MAVPSSSEDSLGIFSGLLDCLVTCHRAEAQQLDLGMGARQEDGQCIIMPCTGRACVRNGAARGSGARFESCRGTHLDRSRATSSSEPCFRWLPVEQVTRVFRCTSDDGTHQQWTSCEPSANMCAHDLFGPVTTHVARPDRVKPCSTLAIQGMAIDSGMRSHASAVCSKVWHCNRVFVRRPCQYVSTPLASANPVKTGGRFW